MIIAVNLILRESILMIYLDYAAHAPADPVVLERFYDMERRFRPTRTRYSGGQGRPVRKWRVTERIAALTGASPAEVIFTSGATGANNLAIKGHRTGVTAYRQAYHLPHHSSIPRSAAA